MKNLLYSSGLLSSRLLFDDTPQEIVDRRNGLPRRLLVSCGMGLNSVAGLVLLRAWGDVPDAILFADTGGEKQATYRYLPILDDWLSSNGFPLVTVVRRAVNHDKQKNEAKYDTLEGECAVKRCLPSIAYYGRSCSQKWKHEPQDKWARNDPATVAEWDAGRRVVKAIFYDAGESYRASVNRTDRFQFWHPLFTVGWGRAECERAVELAGLPPVPKSSCFFCPEMTPAEIFDLQDTEPDLFERALAMERNAELTSIKGLGKHEFSWAELVEGRVPLATVDLANRRTGRTCVCSDDMGVVS